MHFTCLWNISTAPHSTRDLRWMKGLGLQLFIRGLSTLTHLCTFRLLPNPETLNSQEKIRHSCWCRAVSHSSLLRSTGPGDKHLRLPLWWVLAYHTACRWIDSTTVPSSSLCLSSIPGEQMLKRKRKPRVPSGTSSSQETSSVKGQWVRSLSGVTRARARAHTHIHTHTLTQSKPFKETLTYPPARPL